MKVKDYFCVLTRVSTDWRHNMSMKIQQLAKDLGYTGQIPKGATGVHKGSNGELIFDFGNGKPSEARNADGSTFNKPADTAPADNGAKPADNGAGNKPADNSLGNENGSGSIFVNGGQASSDGFGVSGYNINGSFNIDPNAFMGASSNLWSTLNWTSNIPLGLGSILGQGAIGNAISNFANAVGFNFDYSKYFAEFDRQRAQQNGTTVTAGDGQPDTSGTTPTAGSATTSGTAGTSGTSGTSASDASTKAQEAKQKAKTARTAKHKEEAAKLAESLYDAMKGAGTKNKQLKETLAKLNNNNVMLVLEEWDKNYSSDMDGETLIQSIQDEYHSGFFTNEQKNVEKILCDALYNKAMSLGMSSEAHAFRAKINAEHGNSWWAGGSSDSSVQNSVDTIIAQIRAKEGQTTTQTQTQS